MKRVLRSLICICIACGPHAARTSWSAQHDYPNKAIRLIVASSPAGPNDLIARAIAAPWGEMLGRPLVIDNRAGAAGIIGTDLGAKASPDGYTLLVGFQGPLVIAPNLNDSTPYHTLRDFTPISLAVSSPFVLVVHPGVPVKSVNELIALAKARPGKLNFASGGTGIGSHMAMELLKYVTGTDMVHVPYKGAGPGLAALMAGEVQTMFIAVSAALPHIKAERVRALALGGEKRFPLLPDLPTIGESGYRFNCSSWYGVLAPQKTPRAIVAALHGTLVRVLNAPAMRGRLTDMAFEVSASTPEAFATLLREELATWGKVISAAGLKGKT